MTKVVLPLRIWPETNLREHWGARARRAARQRKVACLLTRIALRSTRVRKGARVITLIRIAPRQLDSDNCVSGLKAVRDGVADALGIDDGDPRLTWVYGQRKGEPKQYAVGVEIKENPVS